MSAKKYRLIGLTLCLLGGCAESSTGENLSDFRVISRGQDGGGDFCSDFRITAAQAAWLFERATIVTAAQQHDRFNYLPCWVRGTVQGGGGTWQWEVRAGGTARLVAPDGAVRLLGCDDCEDLLRGNEEPPPFK